MKEPLQRALLDAVELLESRRIRFALIGGLAASIRGRTRVTEDIDFVVQCTSDQAVELATSLDETKFKPLFAEFEELIRRSFLLPLSHRSTGITLDLAIGVSGFEQQVVRRATLLDILDRRLPVATAEDLMLMKILAGRPQDDQDIQGIVSAAGSDLDWEYCAVVAKQLQEALGMDIAVRLQRLRDQSS